MSLIEKALAKQKLAQEAKKQESVVSEETNAAQQDPSAKLSASEVVKPQVTETIAPKKASVPRKVNVQPKASDTQFDIVLNAESLINRGFIYEGTGNRLSQEEYRSIKRKLLNNAFGPTAKTLNHNNLIMITSSNANEGKTFVSINLALSMALEQDKTVLLVDADVLRPSINRELEFEMKQGLLEYLLCEVNSLADIIYTTNIENLKVIPAGKPHNLTNELLASDKMEAVAKELAERYPDRIVIFDCPPILGVTETPVLSNLMGQAVVVVEESKSNK